MWGKATHGPLRSFAQVVHLLHNNNTLLFPEVFSLYLSIESGVTSGIYNLPRFIFFSCLIHIQIGWEEREHPGLFWPRLAGYRPTYRSSPLSIMSWFLFLHKAAFPYFFRSMQNGQPFLCIGLVTLLPFLSLPMPGASLKKYCYWNSLVCTISVHYSLQATFSFVFLFSHSLEKWWQRIFIDPLTRLVYFIPNSR